MRTSIVIPTHNRSQMVRRAIQSALDCGPRGSEVIVVNDGSKDDTEEVLDGYAPRVRAIHLPLPVGRSKARNLGVESARGEFVILLDDDDWFLPGGPEALEQALSSAGPTAIVAYGRPEYVSLADDAVTILADRELPGMGSSGSVVSLLLKRNFIQCGTAIVRRKDYLNAGGCRSSSEPSEDWAIFLCLALRGDVVYVDRPVTRILRHAGNTDPERFFFGKLDVLQSEIILDLIRKSRAQGNQEVLNSLSSVLLRFAAGCQHRSRFRTARRLVKLYCQCGKVPPLFTKEQLWRSWLPGRINSP